MVVKKQQTILNVTRTVRNVCAKGLVQKAHFWSSFSISSFFSLHSVMKMKNCECRKEERAPKTNHECRKQKTKRKKTRSGRNAMQIGNTSLINIFATFSLPTTETKLNKQMQNKKRKSDTQKTSGFYPHDGRCRAIFFLMIQLSAFSRDSSSLR